MKKWLLGPILVIVLVLNACGSQPAVAPAQLAAVNIDPANLPLEIDAATTAALQNNPDIVLIDVREQEEYDAGHIPGVALIPLGQVPDRMSEIPKDKTVILTCRSGNRSGQAADFLREQGYTNVHNMQGGIKAWQAAGLPIEQ